MRSRRVLVAVSVALALSAQSVIGAEGDERRGSVPPGTSRDGSRPNEGAIKGGSIDAKRGADSAPERSREIDHCRDLEGTLRRQCVADARSKERSESKGTQTSP
jgi:hypothetical protein